MTLSYRSAEHALRERTRLLEEQRTHLEEQRQKGARLDDEARTLEKNLANAKTLLTRFEQKRALPMLDAVKIASPCSADWSAMQGDDKTRYCGKCEKNVYNLSAMTREEAELLMLEKEGELCIRLYRRTDGTVLTQDCPVGVRRKRLRLVGVLAIGGGLAASLAGFGAHRALHRDVASTERQHRSTEMIQGAMVSMPDPTPPAASLPPAMGTVAAPPTDVPKAKAPVHGHPKPAPSHGIDLAEP